MRQDSVCYLQLDVQRVPQKFNPHDYVMTDNKNTVTDKM